jgi:hypothetical protein
MNFGFSGEFVDKVLSELTPFQHLSGTEHVGPLLYSLIRMLRPQNVVEFGTGFTTPFILQALKDNADDFKRHQAILKKKAAKHFAELSDEKRADMTLDEWWDQAVTQEVYGHEPVLPIPSYYLKPYKPHLFSFELLPEGDSYVQKLQAVVKKLRLNKFFTLNAGVVVTDYMQHIPKERQPIDFAWNDFGNKHRFYKETYQYINPNGGIMAFHNTTNSELDFKADLDEVMAEIKSMLDARKCELLTFLEPHKFTQRSMTVLRKLEAFEEHYYDDERLQFDKDLMQLPRVGSARFP